jgi:Tol biopolymer transport system component
MARGRTIRLSTLLTATLGALVRVGTPASAPALLVASRAGDLSTGLVAYSTADLPQSTAIAVSRLDGSERRLVTRRPGKDETRWDEQPAWSPDGTDIAFTRTRGVGGRGRQDATATVHVAQVATAASRRISPNASRSAIWSPDGGLIAFSRSEWCFSPRLSGTGLYVVSAEGSELRRVVPDAPRVRDDPKLRRAFYPQAWSPDGRSLLYLEWTADCQSEQIRESLFSVDIRSGDPRLLVTGRTTLRAFGPLSPGTFFGKAAWSPDGRLIAYTHACDAGPGGTVDCDLFVSNADGSRRGVLKRSVWDTGVVWANREEVFFSDERLQTVSVATGRSRSIARNLQSVQHLSLSRDGTKVALVSSVYDKKLGDCVARVALVELDTGRVTRGRRLPSCRRPYSFYMP